MIRVFPVPAIFSSLQSTVNNRFQFYSNRLELFLGGDILPGKRNILLIGIGNPFRRDDGVGCFIAREVKKRNFEDVSCREHRGEGIDLIEQWKDCSTVIAIDAILCEEKPGTIFRYELPPDELPKSVFACSTHALNIADVIHLAKTLDRCPPKIIVYGIAGKNFEMGQGFSDEVQEAASKVVNRIVFELQYSTSQK